MKVFNKEEHDVSLIFLAFLTFQGNCTKVGLALKMRPEVVEVLAAKENWEAKLKTYVGLRHEKRMAATDGAIRKTVTFIQACHLRDLTIQQELPPQYFCYAGSLGS